MKGWEVTETEVIRKGEVVAKITGTHFSMEPGKKNFTNMVKKVLKGEGKTLVQAKRVQEPDFKPVEVETTSTLAEEVTAEIPNVEDLPPPPPPKREFILPPDVVLESPPKEKVTSGHKATLHFSKNGRAFKCSLDYVPDDEQILTFIRQFKH
jgi:hypothetical protein